jgi:hypothetical protein
MTEGKRVARSAAQRTELWSRWKAGQSLHVTWRAFGKPLNSVHGFFIAARDCSSSSSALAANAYSGRARGQTARSNADLECPATSREATVVLVNRLSDDGGSTTAHVRLRDGSAITDPCLGLAGI